MDNKEELLKYFESLPSDTFELDRCRKEPESCIDFDFVLGFLEELSFPSHCVDRTEELSRVVDIVKWWKG